MKRAFMMIIIMVSLTLTADPFSLLTAGKYDEAKRELQSVLSKNPTDSLALYNMGVLSEKTDKTGDAVYYYLRALSVSPDFSEARRNVELLKEKHHLVIPAAVTEPAILIRPFVLLIVVVYLFVFIVVFNMFRPHWMLKVAMVPLILIVLLLAFWFVGKYHDYRSRSFAVARVEEKLMSGPDSSLSSIGSVKEGEVVKIMAVSGQWSKVESVQDNVEGWVPLHSLGMLERSYR